MSSIPEEVKQKIQEKYIDSTVIGLYKAIAAEYGYSLAVEEIERLKGLIKVLWYADKPSTSDIPDLWNEFKQTNKL